jgi:Dihydrofolate reductase
MRKLVLFMHTSLDGFVAGPNGEMDWIIVDDEIFEFVGNRVEEGDTALYGRVTYDMMEGYWPTAADQPNASKHDIDHSRWYMKANKIVMSRTMKGKVLPNTKIINDNLVADITSVKQEKGSDILIFGSPSAAHALLKENLIDEFWLFQNPILLGQGIPVFKNIPERFPLKLVKAHAFSNGVVCLNYQK